MRTYSRRFALAGLLLGLGAPLGLLVLRIAMRAGDDPAAVVGFEIRRDVPLYLYVTIATSFVMSAFGWVLGRQEDRLAALSLTDALTGLWNRRHFDFRLEEESRRAERYRSPLSLLIIDVDRFKLVNDRFGHLQGDRVLRRIAELVRDEFRGSDVVCRYGGEEISVIAPNTRLEEAAALAERVRARIASSEMPGMGGVRVTISAGIASLHDGTDGMDLTSRADDALYAAKASGRNCIRLHGAEDEKAEMERQTLH